jgi:hypothetical protein
MTQNDAKRREMTQNDALILILKSRISLSFVLDEHESDVGFHERNVFVRSRNHDPDSVRIRRFVRIEVVAF